MAGPRPKPPHFVLCLATLATARSINGNLSRPAHRPADFRNPMEIAVDALKHPQQRNLGPTWVQYPPKTL